VSVIEDSQTITIPDSLDQDEACAYRYVITYLTTTQKRPLSYFKTPSKLYKKSLLKIDAFSLDNLEIINHARDHEKYGSLYWLLDQTSTPMGSRLLKDMLMHPSADLQTITYRHDIVGSLLDNYIFLDSFKDTLHFVYDIPRILSRINYRNANARDLVALKKSLNHIPLIQDTLQKSNHPVLQTLATTLVTFPQLVSLLEQAVEELPPVSIKEGGMFKQGYDDELDALLTLSHGGKQALLALEVQEKNLTGIKNLKVGFNKVFGYYIEISNGQLGAIKQEFGYERKQTLSNGERFINAELKSLETKILSAEAQRLKREETLFLNLLDQLTSHTIALQSVAEAIAFIDVMVAFAFVSHQYGYHRPTFTRERKLTMKTLRHPIIEKVMQSSRFVANDIGMDEQTNMVLITGPNMGGKSTFMRQVALAVVMAQAGCFIAAENAEMMIFDAVLTRMGATDDLLGGQSTFMMEMSQTNFALTHATEQSLLIFDEIGRGTATYDGMALAQAILEYIDQHIHAKTLFSTHYHELTQLSETMRHLKNIHVAVHQDRDQITFLYQVKPGSMNQSFGIHVAQLAQLPLPLIQRANAILSTLEKQSSVPQAPVTAITANVDTLRAMLRKIDPDTLTPIDALTWLYTLKKLGE
jgi:DNA mismatch repair protein MutS